MKPLLLATLISATLLGCTQTQTIGTTMPLPAGVSLVAQQAPLADGISIPYKKYKLANGLTLVLHEDKSDPLVHVDVTYHVGSNREEIGKSGFAHLFEHMMFQGSQNVADEEHFKIITEAGGTLNGTTNSDRTNYFETVPSNQLEKMLWLEADRMGYFLPALTEEKFEVQRETVKNERAQRVDNQPYGRMHERFSEAFYPEAHPYSWPVIGWPEDLERAELADVKAFFQRWYGPNNATLTIGGNFDEAQTLAWVNKYFGDIPAGEAVTPLAKTPVTLDKTRYISMEDKVHLPLLRVGIPTVYARHQDEAALDLLASILGGGQTSLFYKNMVKDGHAVQASVSHYCQELSCQMFMIAVANPAKGGKLADIEQRVNESIAEFESRGVTDEDLAKAKVQFEADTVFGLQSVRGKVSTLAHNQTFFNKPDLIQEDLARYQNVTKADVMRVFHQYIKGKPAVIMSVVPEGQSQLIAASDNFKPKRLAPQTSALTASKIATPSSSFDRSQMPNASKAPLVSVPSLWTASLANHIEVMGTQSNETPTVELVIYLNGGHSLLAPEQAGLASLTAALMNESSQTRSTEALAQALELLGSSIHFDANKEQSYVRVSSLTENLAPTLKILEEKLFTPGFTDTDFHRIKQQQLQSIQHNQTSADSLARSAYARLMYGKQHIKGQDVMGSVETMSALTLADVKNFYQKQYTAGNAEIVAVSNLSKSQLLKELTTLSKWQGAASAKPNQPQLPTLAGGTIYLVDKPEAAQSVIMLGKHALPYDATGEYFKARLMNYPLGGAFNSRINLNLREDKGYTYGARSYFSGNAQEGSYTAYANVRSDVTDKALVEFVKEIKGYQQAGITADELSFMRNSIAQGEALDYETPYQKAGFIRGIQKYDLPTDYTEQQAQIINNISASEINQIAQSQLNIDDMVILVVGDRKSVEPTLKALGYPVQVLEN